MKGLKHGRGVFEVPSKGDIYTGEFKHGMRDGKVNRFIFFCVVLIFEIVTQNIDFVIHTKFFIKQNDNYRVQNILETLQRDMLESTRRICGMA